MALVFLTVGALIAVALTTFSSTNFLATASNRTLRVTNYAADGAMEAAIQQVRYHGGACDKTFPKTGSSSLYPHDSANDQSVLVTCTTTAISLITATAVAGSPTLTSPSSTFSSVYVTTRQPVADSSGTILSSGTTRAYIASVSSDGTTATMNINSPYTGTVYIGQDGQTFDTFYACTSSPSSTITSCTSGGSAAITATVLFQSLNTNSACGSVTSATGCQATVESWIVKDANA